ncbi:O-linked N-acetylglucosamine transferase family protein [Zavarzinia sp. CC-PAN008]|uniref:O-linked N-acetylglucosamine transferase, SPINDLY family protein n=1 Tax=Zavarzinia sp. CC-PAN008 TaxID=3243332 RepID=UPI003F7471F0
MPDPSPEADPTATAFAEAINRARARQLDIAVLLETAETLKRAGRPDRVVELYKTWIAFNGEHPTLFAVYFNYAVSLSELPDAAGAINALRATIALKPDFYPPQINLGSLLDQVGQADRAVATWLALAEGLPSVTGDAVTYKALALKQAGRVLEVNNSDAAAEDALARALDLNQDQPDVVQHWIALRQRQCKWPVIQEWGHVKRRTLIGGISPLSAACHTDDPMFQLANGAAYNRGQVGLPTRPPELGTPVTPATRKPGRIRIGYVSSDLREHAVGFSMTEVVELHDRAAFEVFAYYCGVPAQDSTHKRIKANVDHWTDLTGISDEQAAVQMRADGIDILVDLNGYTKDARTKVFACKPAPINVNWFGYPSSMGSPYHHYLVADAEVIPPGSEIYYSEKVLRLPCYQPNDRRRVVSPRVPARAEAGLPQDAFVYCCLNGMQKITPIVFQRWMTILRYVPGSVLWLLTGTADANERLRQAAAAAGIAPERIVFAEKKPNPEHLARYVLADLFLDTAPYGAHTTASDSLWMGVPILTLPGRSFPSRVCADLVRAAGLPELVATSADDYARKAIGFGQERETLQPLRDALAANRDTCLLFDTPRLVAALEDLYREMFADFEAGRVPQPNLANLDVYRDVALDFDLPGSELLDDVAFLAQYRERLAEHDLTFPLVPDGRLWP